MLFYVAVILIHVRLFSRTFVEYSIDGLRQVPILFQLPEELWAISCPTLEEFHMTLSGIRAAHNGFGKNNLMSLLGALLNANINPRIHTIVFKLNAP